MHASIVMVKLTFQIIDYILVDHNVMQCTQAIGYEPFSLHILSNHRGIFLDLATT